MGGRDPVDRAAVARSDGEAVSDLEQVVAMLTRASIPFHTHLAVSRSTVDAPPEGSTLLYIREGEEPPYTEQPHRGGYTGFWTEMVFDPDGALWAVWAWE